MTNNNNIVKDSSLWVFGYGSLCWNPGFEFGDSVIGYIEGFSRKFWQGNTTHRGTDNKPGRVATLVEEKRAKTHGVAFKLLGESALDYLKQREITLGGYNSHITLFHPTCSISEPIPVLLYVATPSNKHWLGPATPEQIANQVVQCSGPSGHNVEYVLRLANWLRESFPMVQDDHLYDIENVIYREISKRKLCLKTLMGELVPISSVEGASASASSLLSLTSGNSSDEKSSSSSVQLTAYSSRLDDKNLRCVKM